ncbi:MAG: hypothetical protein S4CHLAM2_00780 [Chlamydiales bacterium]|nr:hypothetical protein [Chlamydiales bacterium]
MSQLPPMGPAHYPLIRPSCKVSIASVCVMVAFIGIFALMKSHPGTVAFYAAAGGEMAAVAALATTIGFAVRVSLQGQKKQKKPAPEAKTVEESKNPTAETRAAFLERISTTEPIPVYRRGLLQDLLREPNGLEKATERELNSASKYMIGGKPISLVNTEFADRLGQITSRSDEVMAIVENNADPILILKELSGFENKEEIMALYRECRAQAVKQAVNTSYARYVINQIIVADLMIEVHKRYANHGLEVRQLEQSKASSANTSFNIHCVGLEEHVTIEQRVEISDTSETLYLVKGTLKLNMQTGDAVITWTQPQAPQAQA